MSFDMTWLPPNLVVLYDGGDVVPRRGPRPALSRSAVVQTAIDIADTEGLGGVSMAKVAERLGYTTMSLYRYVKNKDELLILMADQANGDQPPQPTPDSWRDGLEAWARGIFGVYRAHPWLLRVTISGPPAGPSQLRWMEAGLANLADTGLHEGMKLQTIQLLHGYARGEAQMSTDLTGLGPEASTAAHYGAILRAVTTPVSHPSLARLLDSGVLDGPTDYDEELDFGFGLATVLAGVTQLIDGLPAAGV